jgi:hypothetical protein
MKMTYEDIEEYRKNADEILKKESRYATAKAVDRAFDALVCVQQFKWERDIALEQLEELGLSFGQKIEGVYLSKEEHEKLLEYKYMYENLCK